MTAFRQHEEISIAMAIQRISHRLHPESAAASGYFLDSTSNNVT